MIALESAYLLVGEPLVPVCERGSPGVAVFTLVKWTHETRVATIPFRRVLLFAAPDQPVARSNVVPEGKPLALARLEVDPAIEQIGGAGQCVHTPGSGIQLTFLRSEAK